MFRAIAALILASAAGAAAAAAAVPTSSSDTLLSSSPWWEKVTVTIAGDGKTQGCRYESSLQPNAGKSCDVASSPGDISKSSGSKEEYTRITFERRFTPGALPTKADLQTGDTLLGGQVMALAIDARGHVNNCKIVAASGDMRPEYGCDEATAERFNASVGGAHAPAREGYMTILVYGHSEHMV